MKPLSPRQSILGLQKTLQTMSAAEAVKAVESGDRVYLHGGAATPSALVDALMGRAGELADVEIVHLHTEAPAPYTREPFNRTFRHNALFIGENVRAAVAAGDADYTPVFLSDIPRLFEPGEALELDVALIQVTPPDADGYCSLGPSVDCAPAAIANAKTVIAQMNPSLPRSLGTRVPLSDIDRLVEWDMPIPECGATPGGPVAQAIGRFVAELVPDGATLQLGIGAIPDAVLSQLTGHRHLGVHTEMFTDGLIPLVHQGIVDGSRKTLDPGIIVTTFVLGSRSLYEFIDSNPLVELRPVSYTNDVAVVAAQERMVAINSALSVDLTGQVCADSIGPHFYSGIGGQVDFIRGASLSREGVPIIALPSTAKNGTVSRICPELIEGSGVVTTRGDVHWVVTEYGARNLHGASIRRRAQMLIEIAHPDFRKSLEEQAFHLGYLGRRQAY